MRIARRSRRTARRLYVPMRDSDSWWVIDAEERRRQGKDQDRTRPNLHGSPDRRHRSAQHLDEPDGSRVYMSVLTVPWIYIADTRTNQVIGKQVRSEGHPAVRRK